MITFKADSISYTQTKTDDEITVSCAMPKWHKADAESDERLISELIDAGAPKWIDGDFDDSGVLDGEWWVKKRK